MLLAAWRLPFCFADDHIEVHGNCVLKWGGGDRTGTDLVSKAGVISWKSCARYCHANAECECWVLKLDETCYLRSSCIEDSTDDIEDSTDVLVSGQCDGAPPAREYCYEDHRRGNQCSWNRSKEDCLEKFYDGAGKPGLDRIEQICGWTTEEGTLDGPTPYFNGKHKRQCRSKPWVMREKVVEWADFGACTDAVMQEAIAAGDIEPPTASPTLAPVCPGGTCSQFNGVRKACEGSPLLCDIACSWNKKTNNCEPYACKHFNVHGVKCTSASKKKGLTCYYNIATEECEGAVPKATCKDYDQFVLDESTESEFDEDEKKTIATRSVSRRRCSKLGKPYRNCKWSRFLEKCIEGDKEANCRDIAANANKCKNSKGCQLTTVNGCMNLKDVRCSDYKSSRKERKCFKGSKGGLIKKGKGCKVLMGRCVDA